jgi:hypothetical protein
MGLLIIIIEVRNPSMADFLSESFFELLPVASVGGGVSACPLAGVEALVVS